MDTKKFLSVPSNPATQGRRQEYTSFTLPHWGAALPAFFATSSSVDERPLDRLELPSVQELFFLSRGT